jgi:hypothetical protein
MPLKYCVASGRFAQARLNAVFELKPTSETRASSVCTAAEPAEGRILLLNVGPVRLMKSKKFWPEAGY